VPAGCVFWIKGATASFAMMAADHTNCSVGSFTHGFLTLEEAATKDDVAAVLVVLLRINGFALMTLRIRSQTCIEGKPQCHIIATAKLGHQVRDPTRRTISPRHPSRP
jgi:hypothetical protein